LKIIFKKEHYILYWLSYYESYFLLATMQYEKKF